MRFKTFLLRLFKSSFFWLAIIAFVFTVIVLSKIFNNREYPDSPTIEPSSGHFDVTIDSEGVVTITSSYTYNSAGVAEIYGDSNGASISCVGEQTQTFQPIDLKTTSPKNTEYLTYPEMIEIVEESGQRVVRWGMGGNRLFVNIPDKKECTVSSTYINWRSAERYLDKAAIDLFSPYYIDGPMSVDFHLPIPEGENLKDSVEVKTVVPGTSSPFLTVHDNVMSIKAGKGFPVALSFPRHWLNENATINNINSAERGTMYQSLRKVPFSEPNDETKGAAKDPQFAWKYLPLSDVDTIWFVLSVIVIGGGIVFAYIWKRKKKDDIFSGKYWRDVPDKELDPVVVGRLWAHNSEVQIKKDVPIAVMSLINKGAVALAEHNGKSVLKRPRNFNNEDLTPVDEVTLGALFTHKYKEKVSLSELEKRRNEIAQKVRGVIDDQVDDVEEMVRLPKISFLAGVVFLFAIFTLVWNMVDVEYGTFIEAVSMWPIVAFVSALFLFPEVSFAKSSRKIRWSLWGLSAVFFAASLMLAGYYLNDFRFNYFWPAVILTIWGAVYILLGFYVSWRSRRVESIVAKAEGLKNWLEDFTLLDEKPPSDVKVWGEFMVYATVFGVADKVDKELDGLKISIFNDDVFRSLVRFAKGKNLQSLISSHNEERRVRESSLSRDCSDDVVVSGKAANNDREGTRKGGE